MIARFEGNHLSGHVTRMEQSVTVKFRWTADEFLQAHRYHFRHTCRPVFRFGQHFIYAVMLVGGVAGLILDGGGTPIPLITFVVIGVNWFTLGPFERRWIIRYRFSKRPDKDAEIEWRVTPDALQTRSGLGHSEFSWHALSKIVLTPTGVMLYPNDQVFHWLPRHGFASDADFERFVELAKSRIQRHYDVA